MVNLAVDGRAELFSELDMLSLKWSRLNHSRCVHAGKRVSMVQFRFTSKNVSEASVTLPSGCGGMEGIKVLMTVLLCHRQQKL